MERDLMKRDLSDAQVIVIRDGLGAGALLMAFLGGALAGATAALLTAPQSGSETRARLREAALRPKELLGRVPDAVAGAVDAFSEALKDGDNKDAKPAAHSRSKQT